MADTKTKGTREWYQAQLRKFAQRERWPLANRLDYLYQLLLNYIETYPTMEDGSDKVWLLKWTDYIKRSCVYAMMQKQSGNFGGIYWSVLKIEAQHRQLDSYMLFLERKRQAGTRFYEPRRKILVKFGVIQALQDLLDDKLDILALSMPPGTGKLLADDTPVLTTKGWKRHGDIEVGDYVYGIDGKPKKVLHVFPKDVANCVIEFTNGETICCHENHEWAIYDRHCMKEHILEAKHFLTEPLDSGEEGKRGHRYFYQLPHRQALDGDDIDLPIKPYTLGAWLGDGRNNNPDICGDKADRAVIDAIIADGYEISWHTTHSVTGVEYYGFKTLRADLQKVGMCHSRRRVEKHIPEIYLTASKRQRLELLAGLLDTDGCLPKGSNKYKFTTVEEELRDSFVELVSTFGWRCCVIEYSPHGHDEIVGKKPYWTIQFCPTETIPCRLERKQMHLFSKQRRIAVKSAKRIEPVQGNCIQVEGGIYCVGKTMLPTHNSTLEIFTMSGVLGWYPEMPNLLSSFSGTMTKSLYDGVCQILADKDEYEWHTLFPDVEFDLRSGTNSKDQTINVGKPKRFKSLTCRAIGASLTGSTRCEYLLCADDLCSGIEEAMSIDRLNKLWQAYNTDLKTRKKDRAKELHIATRWSVHDVIGRLQEANRTNPRARFLSVPALDDNGESNFQYAGGVGFSTAYFQDIKNSMDDVSFKCLFMNEPIEREGLLYHDDEIRRYVTLPIAEPDAVLSVVDTKNKGTDYFFQPVFLKYGEDYYLADCICSDNSDYETQYARSAKIILDYEVQACKFESNNGGDRVALEVSNRVKEAKGYCNITQEYTTQNKETQIIVYAPWVKQHVIFRDRSLYQPKDDYGIMMSFLLGHAAMGKNKHDDVPDGLSSFAKWRSRPEDIPVIVGRRPF